MAVAPRVEFNDGELVTPDDLVLLQKHQAYWLANDLLYHLFGNTEAGRTYPITGATGLREVGLDTDLLAQTPDGFDPADLGGTALRSFGFLGQSLRVTRVDANTVRVFPGWGLQYATSGVPSGESALRVVRLAALKSFTIPSASVATQFRRDLVCAKWNDKTTSQSVQVMDVSGNIGSSSEPKRVEPEVDDTVPTIQVVSGTNGATATAAARPAVPAGYIALAEVLVSDAGIVNADQNNASTRPGIRDLRPRLVAHKAMGFVAARRASCSTDEALAVPDVRRFGAKAVGEEVVRGIRTIPTSAGVRTLDTSRDWRDQLIEVEHGQLVGPTLLPGESSDTSFQFASNPVGGGTASLAKVVFFSGSGSADGTAGYRSTASLAPGDGATTSLIFFANSTTGALEVRGVAHTSGVQELYFCARGFGPLGKRPATGVEA